MGWIQLHWKHVLISILVIVVLFTILYTSDVFSKKSTNEKKETFGSCPAGDFTMGRAVQLGNKAISADIPSDTINRRALVNDNGKLFINYNNDFTATEIDTGAGGLIVDGSTSSGNILEIQRSLNGNTNKLITVGLSGLLTANNNLKVMGTTFTGGLTSSGPIAASSGLNVTGTTNTGTLTAGGLVTANNGLNVTGATNTKALTAGGLVTAGSGLNVTGATNTGALTAGGLITANNDLNVTGVTNTGALTAGGLITANNGLNVTGATNTGTLTAGGLVTTNDGLIINKGKLFLNSNQLNLKDSTDTTNFIGWNGGSNIDGPKISGANAGLLSIGAKDILKWEQGKITVGSDVLLDVYGTINANKGLVITGGNVAMNNNILYLRSNGDNNHRIQWNLDRDGPIIVGNLGGSLNVRDANGMDQERLRWNKKGVRTSDWGFGPYRIWINNGCLDSTKFGAYDKGVGVCDETVNNQKWFYNPITGVLRNAADGRCLRADNKKIIMSDICEDSRYSRFTMNEGGLYNQMIDYCLDVGNTDRVWSCSGTNNNQQLSFKSVSDKDLPY